MFDVQEVGAPDGFIKGSQAERSEVFAGFAGDEAEECFDVFGAAFESFAEFGVLRGDTDGAAVFMADAGHDAAEGDEDGGGEAVFFRAEEGGGDDVAPGFELTVRLKAYFVAQVVFDEGLVGFGDAEVPMACPRV